MILYLIVNIGIYYTTLTRKKRKQDLQELFWKQEERPH